MELSDFAHLPEIKEDDKWHARPVIEKARVTWEVSPNRFISVEYNVLGYIIPYRGRLPVENVERRAKILLSEDFTRNPRKHCSSDAAIQFIHSYERIE